MSMPFKSALKALGMNDANAYLALNVFLFFLAQILIWLFWDDDLWSKVSLMAATAFSPISLYLVLPSPEAMSALCLLMALVAYARGKFVLAGVASILGSWQNPPIAFFSFVCGLRWLHGCAGNFKARNARQNALAVLQGAPFALVFVPCIFWLLKFNCLNLISHLGGASFSFISATRVWDLWMDLNQGLIVFPTAMTLLFFACAIVAFIQRKWAGFELPALALALTVGATSTGNWTSVGDIVTRYAVWIMPIALAYPLMAFKGKTLKCAYVFSVAVSAVQTGFFFPGTDANDFFREPAKFVMNHAPSLYRPAPETFCSRGNFVVGDRFQGFNAYVDDNGCIRKAWTSRSALEHAKAHVKVVDSNAFEAVLKVLPDDPHKHVFVDFPADVARKRLPAR